MDLSLYPEYLQKSKEDYIKYFLSKTNYYPSDLPMLTNHYSRYYDRCQRAIHECPIIQDFLFGMTKIIISHQSQDFMKLMSCLYNMSAYKMKNGVHFLLLKKLKHSKN